MTATPTVTVPARGNGSRPEVIRIAGAPKADRRAVRTEQFALFSGSGPAQAQWAMRMYESVPAAYAAISRVAEDISNLPFRILRGPKLEDPEIDDLDHPYRLILEQPNPIMSFQGLIELTVLYLEITGAAYTMIDTLTADLKGGTVRELWPMRPDRVEPIIDSREIFSGYRFGALEGDPRTVPAEAVIPILYSDPQHPVGGHLSPLVPAKLAIQSWGNATVWNNSYFDNGAQPGLIVKTPHQLDPQDKEILRREVRDNWIGTKNAHRVLVLDGFEGEIEVIQNPHKDMAFESLVRLAREEIWSAVNVPKVLAGDSEDLNRAQVDTAKEIYALYKMVPLTKRIEAAYNRFLRPRVAPDSWMRFDLSGIKEIQEDEDAILERKTKRVSFGLATPNQILEEDGASDLQYPEGERHYMAVSLVEVKTEEEKAEAAEALGGLIGPQPSEGKAPPEASEEGAGVDEGEREPGRRSSFGNHSRSPDTELERTMRWRRFDRQLTYAERRLYRLWRSWFKDLGDYVTLEVRKAPPRAQRQDEGDIADFSLHLPNDPETYLPTREAIIAEILRQHGALYRRIVEMFGAAAAAEIAAEVAFDAGTPTLLALVSRDRERIGDAVANLLDELRGVLEAGLNQGETVKDLAARIDAVVSKPRAMRIARTEALAAANSGTFEGYKQTGVEEHEWLSARDARVRDTHRDADGQRVRVGEPFTVGGALLLYPGDPSGPPEEIVNCRCTPLPVVSRA